MAIEAGGVTLTDEQRLAWLRLIRSERLVVDLLSFPDTRAYFLHVL